MAGPVILGVIREIGEMLAVSAERHRLSRPFAASADAAVATTRRPEAFRFAVLMAARPVQTSSADLDEVRDRTILVVEVRGAFGPCARPAHGVVARRSWRRP